MRGRVPMPLIACALVLVLSLLSVPVGAQAPAAMSLVDDTSGDVALSADDQAAPDALGLSALDLRDLSIQEQKDLVTFTLKVQDVTSGGRSDYLFYAYNIYFTMDDTAYRASIFWSSGDIRGNIWSDAGEGRWDYIGQLYPTLDSGADSFVVEIGRELLLNSQGAEPQPGWLLGQVWVESRTFTIDCCEIMDNDIPVPLTEYGDRMPDAGTGVFPYAFQLGIPQTGHAYLASDAPTRSSNGEAATFVFEVEAMNRGESEDRFEVAVRGAPSLWNVDLPRKIVSIDGGANTTIPIIINTPFAHQHGSFQSFLVEMTSLSDRSAVGRVELGIRYTHIPQPTGHHDTVWFHSAHQPLSEFGTVFGTAFGYDGTTGYMNAAEEDEADADRPIPAMRAWRGEAGTQEHLWRLWLSPGLDMGIDWDLTRTGTIQVPVEVAVPTPGAHVFAELVYRAPSEGGFDRDVPAVVRLATGTSGEPVDIDSRHVFEFELEGTPEADFIRWRKDASMHLDIWLMATGASVPLGPSDVSPRLQGGWAQLALNEYRDPVDDLFSTQGITIHAATPQERMANPGSQVLFLLDLMDHGSGGGTFDLSISGPNSQWAQILGKSDIQIAKDGTQRVSIAVDVPSSAQDGDVADILLQVTNKNDPEVQSMARLLVEVDDQAEHVDETDEVLAIQGLSDAKKNASAPGAAMLIVLAGAALVAARRPTRP